MKKIEAYIRPEKLEDIKGIMEPLHLSGLTIMQVMGCGTQKGWKEFVRGEEIDYNVLSKIKIEIVVEDAQAEAVIRSIAETAKTGEIGDGKIFVSDIADAIRIRTGERGSDALK